METVRRLAEMQRTYVAPAPLMQSRPRPVQLTGGGRALVVLAVLLFAGAIAVGLALSAGRGRQVESRRALLEGPVTTGEVIRLWSSGDQRRRVRYRFAVDGRAYEGQVRVSAERRRMLQVGSSVDVRYTAADPKVNDLGGVPSRGMPGAVPFVVAAAIAAGGALCLFGISGQRWLLSEGRAAPAIVSKHDKHHGSHGSTQHTMTYEFPLMSGAVASGKSGTSNKPPEIGSVITVIYDPDRPKRNKVYPFSLVKPARWL